MSSVFSIRLVNSVLNLPDGQGKFFEEFKLQKNCEINSARQNVLGLVEMTFGLVNASLSLPEWQAVKMTFFAPYAVIFFSWSLTPPAIFLTDKYLVVHPFSFNKDVKFSKQCCWIKKTVPDRNLINKMYHSF